MQVHHSQLGQVRQVFYLLDTVTLQPDRLQVRILLQVLDLFEPYTIVKETATTTTTSYLCSEGTVCHLGEESRTDCSLRIDLSRNAQ